MSDFGRRLGLGRVMGGGGGGIEKWGWGEGIPGWASDFFLLYLLLLLLLSCKGMRSECL